MRNVTHPSCVADCMPCWHLLLHCERDICCCLSQLPHGHVLSCRLLRRGEALILHRHCQTVASCLGRFSRFPRTSFQNPCPAGYYCGTSSTAFPCGVGKYSTSTGATTSATCQPCTGYTNWCPAGSSSVVCLAPHLLRACADVMALVVGVTAMCRCCTGTLAASMSCRLLLLQWCHRLAAALSRRILLISHWANDDGNLRVLPV